MSEVILRDYQQEALNSVLTEFKNKIYRQLIVLPTASGKTFIMAAIAKHFNKKVLLIAHREELIQQASIKIKEFWLEADIGICKGSRKELDHQIVIGSTQTCCRKNTLQQLKKKNFDILLIDETHHAPADTYKRIIKQLGFSADIKKNKLLIGVTATPKRADKKQLGRLFDKIVYSKTPGELIKAEYLSPIVGRRILTSFNLNGVHTKMGDFAVGELASAVNTGERNKFIVSKFLEYSKERKSIAFCADVKHCKDLAQEFQAQNIKAEAVWGAMDKEKRAEVLSSFSKGHIQVVTSCSLLTEGFDEPSIETILMCRPTKSQGLYIQMAGRGLRKHPGKENCLVLDFTDRYHNLSTIITLSKAIPEAKQLKEKKPSKPTFKRTAYQSRIELKDLDQVFDLVGDEIFKKYPRLSLNFAWVDIGDNELSLADYNNNEIVISPEGDGFIANIFYKEGYVEKVVAKPETLENCIELCENFAFKNLTMTFADYRNPWFAASSKIPASQAQLDLLKKLGSSEACSTKLEASLEIRKNLALEHKRDRQKANHITYKKKMFLDRYVIKSDINNITRQESITMNSKSIAG